MLGYCYRERRVGVPYMAEREADRELDLERVKMYFDLNKDLKVAWLVGALIPALVAIFVVTENWAVSNPALALGTNAVVVVIVAIYIVQWYQGLAEFLALVEENLRKIQQGQPVTLSPPPIRSGLLRWIMERN